jgi:hypothetical protein
MAVTGIRWPPRDPTLDRAMVHAGSSGHVVDVEACFLQSVPEPLVHHDRIGRLEPSIDVRTCRK